MRRNLVLVVLALVLAFAVTEYNQYSRCREWRLELALREQGVVPERSWGEATVDFVAGDLIAVGKKWECGIEINRGEAAWATVEAATLVPAIGAAAAWTLRTVGRGLVEIGVAAREATALRGAAGFVRGPIALVGRITARRLPVLVLGGALLALYFGSGQLLLDALALLPWPLQFALWAVLFFCIGRCIWFATHAIALLGTSLGAMWSRLIGPRLVPEG
jgi:hypothetical protein